MMVFNNLINMVNKWIFVVIDHKTNDKIIKAIDVLRNRIKEKFWSLNRNTKNFNRIKKDDEVIFYVGGSDGQKFVGRCTLDSDPYPMTSEQKKQIIGYPSTLFTHAVNLKDSELWEEPLLVTDLKEELTFIKNKDLWQKYFRGSIILLSEEDYKTILSEAKR
ncbi:MAG: EVE domain-containing protein [Nitrososphaerales archaeon]